MPTIIDEVFELRAAVDALTEPTFTKITQHIAGTDKVTRIRHAPLLRQLDDAIRGAMAGTAGSAQSNPSDRSLVNSDALYQMVMISSMIGDWCRIAGVEPRKDPVAALRGWHAAVLAQDIHRPFYTSTMRRWAGVIKAVVNPARELSITTPCPQCDATHWENTEGEKASHPVVMQYRPDDLDILRSVTARCRACGFEWRGITALRALAFDLEQAARTGEQAMLVDHTDGSTK